MSISYHRGDLPAGLSFEKGVAIDSETMGLNLQRDRLCVVQLSAGDGTAHVVHFPDRDYRAPNLRALLSDPQVLKLFHFARFDLAMIQRHFGIVCSPVYCTKLASKLVRTNTDRHGLKDLCRELVGIDLSKQQQTSDWGAPELSEEQVAYAASDVLYLTRCGPSSTICSTAKAAAPWPRPASASCRSAPPSIWPAGAKKTFSLTELAFIVPQAPGAGFCLPRSGGPKTSSLPSLRVSRPASRRSQTAVARASPARAVGPTGGDARATGLFLVSSRPWLWIASLAPARRLRDNLKFSGPPAVGTEQN